LKIPKSKKSFTKIRQTNVLSDEGIYCIYIGSDQNLLERISEQFDQINAKLDVLLSELAK